MTKPTYKFWIERYEDCLYQIDFCIIHRLEVLRYYRLLNYIEKRKWQFAPVNRLKGE